MPPSYTRAPASPLGSSIAAQLEQRLGAAQLELRKLGSERHTLRARLRREADRVQELESALRAEAQLRQQASGEHQAALAGLRNRLTELEVRSAAEVSRLSRELEAARNGSASTRNGSGPPEKTPQGLRRIRGIGPAYQRALEALGVTRVEQIAAWTPSDLQATALKLKVRVERIVKDDWVGQAKALERDAEAEGWD
ncbi:MAG: hypothetical protein K0R38_3323 [Polyangiaceae bacterium]|nr:hypothetical protein [Polyangiaceae bacterium]